MRLLSRYVFRELATSALLGTSLATFVIFLQSQASRALFAQLVRSSANFATIGKLFLLSLPPFFPLTVPFGVLVGILIGLGRMSSDGEITAMRAGGVPSRTVVPPVMVFALLGSLVAGCASLWVTPLAIRSSLRVANRLLAAQVTADVQARVFDEQFPNMVLYIGDVQPGGTLAVWRHVFMADITPAEQRSSGTRAQVDGPRITVAEQAIAVPDVAHNRIQLSLRNASNHEVAKDVMTGIHTHSGHDEQILEAQASPELKAKGYTEMPTRQLMAVARAAQRASSEYVESNIELQRRLTLPIACLTLALVGIPLGISTRKGGRSASYIMAIVLAFFCYYLGFITLTGLARQRSIGVVAAAWLPNIVFALVGLVFLIRLEKPGDRDLLGWVGDNARSLFGLRKLASFSALAPAEPTVRRSRLLLFQIIDSYMLSSFLFYLVVLLTSFVLMTEIYNFFELLSDIVKNRIPLPRVFTYLFFLTPKLIYDTLPVSVLVAVLVTFGIFTKNNEVTALKACGVSLRRLAVPVILMSGVLSAGLFAFDHYLIPQANLKQDAIRNEIKNLPPQTYLRPDRKWIFGQGSRVFFYRYFEQTSKTMVGANVYEIDPKTFDLTREIGAERAHWQPTLNTWVFENGWSRDVHGISETNVHTFQATTFPEITETPEYFLKEVKQDKQMNYLQLQAYIKDLQQAGFDTTKLQVQLHKKFAVPLFALIMAMISIPFGFLVGNRGAMTGIGVSIAVAMAYWGVGQFFEQLGNVNLLPPAAAAWAPDALFLLTGSYLLLRMRT